MTQAKQHIIATIGTLISLALVMLLLMCLHITATLPQEEEGIEITFGNDAEGGGRPDMLPTQPQPQAEANTAPAALSKPSDNDLMVQQQTQEDVLALAKQREQETKQYEQEQERIRQQREQEAREAAEKVAREQAAAEKRAKEQAAIDKAQQAMAGFGNTNTAMGAQADNNSATPSAGIKGNPVGKGQGMVGENTWKLTGRDIRVFPVPSSDFGNKEGFVIVRIWVDVAGNVTKATVIGGVYNDIQNKLALETARKTKFTKGETPQIGEITYKFKLK